MSLSPKGTWGCRRLGVLPSARLCRRPSRRCHARRRLAPLLSGCMCALVCAQACQLRCVCLRASSPDARASCMVWARRWAVGRDRFEEVGRASSRWPRSRASAARGDDSGPFRGFCGSAYRGRPRPRPDHSHARGSPRPSSAPGVWRVGVRRGGLGVDYRIGGVLTYRAGAGFRDYPAVLDEAQGRAKID